MDQLTIKKLIVELNKDLMVWERTRTGGLLKKSQLLFCINFLQTFIKK